MSLEEAISAVSVILPLCRAWKWLADASLDVRQSEKTKERLQPLRSGTPVLSTAELSQLDADWTKWRAEWVKRKKIFTKWVSTNIPLPDVLDSFRTTDQHIPGRVRD